MDFARFAAPPRPKTAALIVVGVAVNSYFTHVVVDCEWLHSRSHLRRVVDNGTWGFHQVQLISLVTSTVAEVMILMIHRYQTAAASG